jgi:hypothetical protein
MAITAKFLADFDDFNTETKKAQSGLTEFEKSAGNVARSIQSDLLAMFSVGAAVTFVKDILDTAGALKDLSQQTQISTDDIQIMAGAMSEFGVSQDELGRGLSVLSKKIAGGSDSVAAALATMGISLKDIQGLTGKDLFIKIEEGLASLKGSLRDTTAATLFGDKLGAAMAGASEDIGATMAKVESMNVLMSKESIDALDAYGEAVARAWTNVKNRVANGIGPLAEGFNTLNQAIDRGASVWEVFTTMLPKGFGLIGTGAEHLTEILDAQNRQIEANAAAHAAGSATVVAAMTDEQRHAEALRILQQNAAVELSAAQIKNLEALKAIGELNATNAAAVGVNATEYKKYLLLMEEEKVKLKELEAQNRLVAEAMKARGDAQGKIMAQIFSTEALQNATDWADAMNTSVEGVGQLSDQINRLHSTELEALEQAMLAGIDALARSGQLTSAQSSEFATLAIQARAALDALKPLITTTDDLVKAQWDYVTALDEANKKAAEVPPAMNPAKESIDAIGYSAQQASSSIFQMSAELYNAIRTAQNADAMNALVPAWGITHPAPGAGIIRNVQPPVQTFNITQPLGTPDQIARAVGGAVTGSYASGGKRLPV